MYCMQVLLKRGFSADADRLALSLNGPVVFAMRSVVQPCAVAFAKVLHQPQAVALGQVADGVNVMRGQFGFGLGAYAVDFATRQGPDEVLHISVGDDGNAIGFVELACHLGQQFVGRNAHRAGEARVIKDGFLN